MTEEQKKKYEEAAKLYADAHYLHQGNNTISKVSFRDGTILAHSEGKKEGWNEAISAVVAIIEINLNVPPYAENELKRELQKLRK